jgi:hypothetical protein
MVCSLRQFHALHSGARPACNAIQFIAGRIVPQKKIFAQRIVSDDEFLEREGTR